MSSIWLVGYEGSDVQLKPLPGMSIQYVVATACSWWKLTSDCSYVKCQPLWD